MFGTKVLGYSKARHKNRWIVFQRFYVWNICLNLFASGIRQITHPYACVGKSESTDNRMWCLVKFVAIRLSQQLFIVCKTIIGEEVIEVFVTTSKSDYIFGFIQSVECASVIKITHML